MVVIRASKLNLPNPSLSPSLLFEPDSLSLALMHSDSSFSLYHSLSSSSISLLSHPRTVIPPPSSSSCFVSIKNPNSSDPRTLFVVSGPCIGDSRLCLRFHVLVQSKGFCMAKVVCNQKGIEFDERFGVLVDCVHGVSVKLAGAVNFFAVSSVSASEVWIFAAKLVGDEAVKLMRCAVIECRRPVFSVGVCSGLLILGEENGVRVFSLRQLVKGRVRKASRPSSRPNGAVGDILCRSSADRCGRCEGPDGDSEIHCNCFLDVKTHSNVASAKQRAIRLQQDSCEVGTCFVAFNSNDNEASKSRVISSLKATSIQALTPKKFLILDSAGNLHVLCLLNVVGPDMTPKMQVLPRVMNVQKLVVHADSSTGTQTIWVSDGYHSVHMIALSDTEAMVNETDRTEKDKLVQISVIQAIFSCEKIEDMTPFGANAILVLGQGFLHYVPWWSVFILSPCAPSFLNRSDCARERATKKTELLKEIESVYPTRLCVHGVIIHCELYKPNQSCIPVRRYTYSMFLRESTVTEAIN